MEVKEFYILFLVLVTFVLSISVVPQVIKVVFSKKIFDAPGGRKIHTKVTPSMGGIGVFLSFMIVAMLIQYSQGFKVQYFYCSLFMLFFTGLRDDLLPVKSVHKLLIQILAASIVAGFANTRLVSLYSFSFLHPCTILPEWLSFFISIFIIVAITNAYNLIDGIDGLAGSIATLLLTVLTFWFAINNFWDFAFLSGSMLGAVLGFLYYNWSPAKIFMGDTGSLVIGFFCATVLIVFMNLNIKAHYSIDSSVVFFLSLFIYPFFDITRVFYLRLKRKRSPFSPDKLHIHLLLKRIGFTHVEITTIIFATSLIWLAIFMVLDYLKVNECIILVLLCLYCVCLNFYLIKKIEGFKKTKSTIDVKTILKNSKLAK